MNLIPTTILTGFLGSGKTTLLKRVLTENHGLRVAVIENEFGEENIDSQILVSETEEQIIQMSNGCICCTIREDLRSVLQELGRQTTKWKTEFRPCGHRNHRHRRSGTRRTNIFHERPDC